MKSSVNRSSADETVQVDYIQQNIKNIERLQKVSSFNKSSTSNANSFGLVNPNTKLEATSAIQINQSHLSLKSKLSSNNLQGNKQSKQSLGSVQDKKQENANNSHYEMPKDSQILAQSNENENSKG